MNEKEKLDSLSHQWTEVVADIRDLGRSLTNRFDRLITIRKELGEAGITLKADFDAPVIAALDAYRRGNADEAPV